MKLLIIFLIIGCYMTAGLSQNDKSKKMKIKILPKGSVIENVNSTKKDNKSKINKKNLDEKRSTISSKGKLSISRTVKNSKQKSASTSMSELRAKQILKTDRSRPIGRETEQLYSNTKHRKRLVQGDGLAERIEIKKIEGHSPVSEEIILKALGNVRKIEARKAKTE
jgi:hypothetical protein